MLCSNKYITTRKKTDYNKKVIAITTKVVVIRCYCNEKKSMQAIVIKSKAIGLCKTRDAIIYITSIFFFFVVAIMLIVLCLFPL